MEEENLCPSLPDNTDSQQDSQTSIDCHYINGDHEAAVLDDTEVQMNEAEAEQWGQVAWSLCPMSCTSPPLSFATVQWDMPDSGEETPPFMTDSSSTNELNSGDVTILEATSPSFRLLQGVNTEEDREEHEPDSLFLKSEPAETDENSEPCDAADVQHSETQEKEDSTHELSDCNNDEEEGHSTTSVSVETEELINTAVEIQVSEDEGGSFIELTLEEEQEEPVLLTELKDTEEGQASANGVVIEEENEEGGEVEEEKSVIDVSCSKEGETAAGSLSNVEVPAEPLQTDDTGLTINENKLIDPQQPLEESLHLEAKEDVLILEDLTSQTEEPEMCEDVDQNVDPQQSEAAANEEEASILESENAERIEDSHELIENMEETHCLEQQQHEHTASSLTELSEQFKMTEESEQTPAEVIHQTEDADQLEPSQALEQSVEMELIDQSTQPEPEKEEEETVCVEPEDSEEAEQQGQTEPSDQNEQRWPTTCSSQPSVSEQTVQSEKTNESEISEQLSNETEVTQQTELISLNPKEEREEQAADVEETVVANGETTKPHMNGGEVDREKACRLARQLFELDRIQRADVVKHLDKDNDFSRAVGEEYLKCFDFTGQSLDHALRSFLKVVILIGETQERERVLQHFSSRFHQCNPDSFSSSGAVLALTCALMLLNTDLHGQHVGKSMSSSKFVSNLNGMNEGGNFSKDLLKTLYNSIKTEPLEWAVDEEELKNSVLVDEDSGENAPLRSKSNPFQDVPHDKTASVVKEGFLQRKIHADIDGKRTPWGRRGWKTFYGVLKGMVLYLQKDDCQKDQQTNEEVVSVHHSLADPAADYTKKPHVFRLQTADWRVFLFQASSKVEMNSWISRINLVSALHSSPPFPAAVGSQRRFCRPILPVSQSSQTLDRQLESHARMLESFKADLSYCEQNTPESKKAKARDLGEHRVRVEYLQHEMFRYEIYIKVLGTWKSMKKTGEDTLSTTDLNLYDKAVCADSVGEVEEEKGLLKKSHSSPSLELELAPPTVVKVRRNISERRTYRKTIVPRWNKEA
ncbi:PH and SEC7 domain-containing protein 4 [Parambassis ranga]|uniref:PH and SEC7 domain-containing protein 4-like n=1 Tax=Parambassis ranga TaxID=210632 RepID=A0A6P7JC30_9TELE|nr:PH and SEC7 domain-containing protein 4-like [Parambassis ranga]XP_028274235.1 PH and SEC7 domain-containing protein 4-like [Parambassis ranga]XP_028274236.1 PH and SEC7 domain-containing protein 4-like [Parambassis ranga]